MWNWQATSAIASIILAVLTFCIIVVSAMQVMASRKQTTAMQEQVRVSQEQVRLSLEAQYDSQRPLLIPDGVLPIKDAPNNYPIEDQHPWLDFGPQECTVTLRNLGPGIALNVWGVILGPQPASQTNEYPQRYSLQIIPMLPISAPQSVKASIGGPMMAGEATIGGYTLYAPLVPPAAERWQKGSTDCCCSPHDYVSRHLRP